MVRLFAVPVSNGAHARDEGGAELALRQGRAQTGRWRLRCSPVVPTAHAGGQATDFNCTKIPPNLSRSPGRCANQRPAPSDPSSPRQQAPPAAPLKPLQAQRPRSPQRTERKDPLVARAGELSNGNASATLYLRLHSGSPIEPFEGHLRIAGVAPVCMNQ